MLPPPLKLLGLRVARARCCPRSSAPTRVCSSCSARANGAARDPLPPLVKFRLMAADTNRARVIQNCGSCRGLSIRSPGLPMPPRPLSPWPAPAGPREIVGRHALSDTRSPWIRRRSVRRVFPRAKSPLLTGRALCMPPSFGLGAIPSTERGRMCARHAGAPRPAGEPARASSRAPPRASRVDQARGGAIPQARPRLLRRWGRVFRGRRRVVRWALLELPRATMSRGIS